MTQHSQLSKAFNGLKSWVSIVRSCCALSLFVKPRDVFLVAENCWYITFSDNVCHCFERFLSGIYSLRVGWAKAQDEFDCQDLCRVVHLSWSWLSWMYSKISRRRFFSGKLKTHTEDSDLHCIPGWMNAWSSIHCINYILHYNVNKPYITIICLCVKLCKLHGEFTYWNQERPCRLYPNVLWICERVSGGHAESWWRDGSWGRRVGGFCWRNFPDETVNFFFPCRNRWSWL